MLQLYDINHNKISPLTNYKDLKIERDLTGNEVLSFSYPFVESENIKEECYIRTQTQEFVIKEISNSDDWISVVAKINLESIKGESVENFEVVNSTINNAVNLALVGTGWTLAYTDITKRRTVRKSKCNAYDVLEAIRSIYKAEFKYNSVSKTISIYSSMGEDKGTYFTDELNLSKLTLQSNSYDFCTRIIPVGKDGLKITAVNSGLDYVENYQYSNKIITVIWEDNRYIDAQSLKDDAVLKLNELSKPVKSYGADIADLAKINDKYTNILDYDLGDTITLLSRDKRLKEKQRIVKIVEYPEEPEKNICEIANRTLRFEDIQSDILDATETVETITTSDGMVDDSKINFDPIRQEFLVIVSDRAYITDLNAAVGRIGTLETTTATITQLNVTNANITTLFADKANLVDLTAATARIGTLEADTAVINTILAKAVFAELAEFGQILAGSSIIAQGAIGSAQISDLSATKLSAGIADLAIVTIQGTDGRLKIANNLLQVFAGTGTLFERIALGDVNGDGTVYGLRIRGSDGTTILFDENGQTKEGFTDGYNKLTDNSLNPVKLDIAQVVTRINNGTTTIYSSKIYMDDKTLEIAFSEINNTVTLHGETITSQGSSITILNNAITLKASQSNLDTTNSNVSGLDTRLDTAEASLVINANSITTKVTQAQVDSSIDAIEIGGRNLFYTNTLSNAALTIINTGVRITNSYANTITGSHLTLEANTEYTISGNVTVISGTPAGDYGRITLYNGSLFFVLCFGGVSGPFTRTFTTPSDIASYTILYIYGTYGTGVVDITNLNLEKGNKATDWTPAPEDIQGQIDDATTRITTAESTLTQNATDITARVTTTTYNTKMGTLDSSISGLDARLDSAELKITDSAITATVVSNITGNEIASIINQTATTIDISASKINLVGAVTVLADITGDLGGITAGTITGATVQTAQSGDRIVLNNSYLRGYDSYGERIQIANNKILFDGGTISPVTVRTYNVDELSVEGYDSLFEILGTGKCAIRLKNAYHRLVINDAGVSVDGTAVSLLGHTHSYLSLSGGKLTGILEVQNTGSHKTMIQNSSIAGEYLFGGSPTSDGGMINYVRVGSDKLQYTSSSGTHNIWHAGNTAKFNITTFESYQHDMIRNPYVGLKFLNSSMERIQVRTDDDTAYGNFTANNITYYNGLTNGSDKRLKKNITPFVADGLDILKRIPMYEYLYKQEDANVEVLHFGTMYQEAPNEITTNFDEYDDPEMNGIDMDKVMWLSVKAIQQLDDKINALHTKIEGLERRSII